MQGQSHQDKTVFEMYFRFRQLIVPLKISLVDGIISWKIMRFSYHTDQYLNLRNIIIMFKS